MEQSKKRNYSIFIQSFDGDYLITDDVYEHLLQQHPQLNFSADDQTIVSLLFTDPAIQLEKISIDEGPCVFHAYLEEEPLVSSDHRRIFDHYAYGIFSESKSQLPPQPRVLSGTLADLL